MKRFRQSGNLHRLANPQTLVDRPRIIAGAGDQVADVEILQRRWHPDVFIA
jgi:hypothetical protein